MKRRTLLAAGLFGGAAATMAAPDAARTASAAPKTPGAAAPCAEGAVLTKTQSGVNTVFPLGVPNTAYAKYFKGQSYLAMLDTNKLCPVANVTFEPGCRNNWHKHAGGQILLVVGGRGWYQEEGKPARELRAGDVVDIASGVKHWHGAAKDSWFEHISIEVRPDMGPATWLEPVSDADYAKLP
jgi:quercetin dioxygenase-like cupin family protein